MTKTLTLMMNTKRVKAYGLFWIVALATLVFDQFTKFLIQKANHDYFDSLFVSVTEGLNIVYVKNTGAAWGVWAGSGQLLGLLAVVALAGIYFLRAALQLKRVPMQWAFGLLVAGITGNMIDRLLLGYVVDFVDLSFAGVHFPAFNVADCAITVGVFAYIIMGTFNPENQPKPAGEVK